MEGPGGERVSSLRERVLREMRREDEQGPPTAPTTS